MHVRSKARKAMIKAQANYCAFISSSKYDTVNLSYCNNRHLSKTFIREVTCEFNNLLDHESENNSSHINCRQ